MSLPVRAYQHGIFPRSEDVVAATRSLERGRTGRAEVDVAFHADRESFIGVQREAGLDYFSDDFEKAVQEVRAAAHGATLVLHTYFGDAGPFVDRLRRLPVDAIGIDFVETDLDELGQGWDVGLVAGVLDGRASPVESVEGT